MSQEYFLTASSLLDICRLAFQKPLVLIFPVIPWDLVKCHQAALSAEPVMSSPTPTSAWGLLPGSCYMQQWLTAPGEMGDGGAALFPFYRQGSTIQRQEVMRDFSDLAQLFWRQGKFIITSSPKCFSVKKKKKNPSYLRTIRF